MTNFSIAAIMNSGAAAAAARPSPVVTAAAQALFGAAGPLGGSGNQAMAQAAMTAAAQRYQTALLTAQMQQNRNRCPHKLN